MMTSEFRPVQDHEISGEEKLRQVTKLVKDLRADLKQVTLLPQERNEAMEQLKVFVRDSTHAGPAYTPEGVEILIQHSFHTPSPTTSRAALQALANVLLSGPATRQLFVDSGYSAKAVARLKNPKKDDELLLSRVLFLTSYGTNQSFQTLIDKHHLADYINDNLARHAKLHAKLSPRSPSSVEDNALTETLKLLFNVIHFCPNRVNKFLKTIGYIVKIISLRTISIKSPTRQPISSLINGLLNLPLAEKKAFPSKTDLKAAVDQLAVVLELTISQETKVEELESLLIPLLTLLKKVARTAPREIAAHMKKIFLPSAAESYDKLCSVDTLSLKLLAHMRAPISTQLHDAINALFFELSDQDADQLSATFGIGVASGFLLSRNNQMPTNPSYTNSIRSSLSSPAMSQGRFSRSSESSQTLVSSDEANSPLTSPVTEVFPRSNSDEIIVLPSPTKKLLGIDRVLTVSESTTPSTMDLKHDINSSKGAGDKSKSQLALEKANASLYALLEKKGKVGPTTVVNGCPVEAPTILQKPVAIAPSMTAPPARSSDKPSSQSIALKSKPLPITKVTTMASNVIEIVEDNATSLTRGNIDIAIAKKMGEQTIAVTDEDLISLDSHTC